ncbi:3-isopropylmalate dehydratase large subunit like [Actinidia chinensis var. chinensis]|uniref:3-isopropylmalate dehydratase large subunit like n=1 Tax=Actinidia chinensis var. chinensis TaxID=1590841 RepID=A0A2R6Q0J7_ACTCC|nr:3-isopropylmalate dehydratase large subunit like [Actinidia chinensis var. chinensis]
MRTKTNHQNRFIRIITLPIRVLSRAKDFYVKSMVGCADRVSYGTPTGVGSGQVSSLPKSFSVGSGRSSDNEDLRELIRAASTRRFGGGVETDLYLQSQMRLPATAAVVPRSCSVGMGRIDEDGPCDFGEVGVGVRPELVYPRSRSYAVPKRSVVF